MKRLRRYLVAGILVWLPLGVTILLVFQPAGCEDAISLTLHLTPAGCRVGSAAFAPSAEEIA